MKIQVREFFVFDVVCIYVKGEKKGGVNKSYNFCLVTCNEACLGYMGILAIGPFN
jgi:hypothetical protein